MSRATNSATARVRRQMQEVGHCGPTCVSMLLGAQGHSATQTEIARAAGVTATVAESGSRIDQLAAGVEELVPQVVVLGRYESDISLLEAVTSDLGLPVGVEWQGRFDSESGPFDIGHYSLITGVHREEGYLDLVDPDAKSFFREGRIAIAEFERRWWEDNDLEPGVKSRSFRLSFVVVEHPDVPSLRAFGYEPVTFTMVRRASTDLSQ